MKGHAIISAAKFASLSPFWRGWAVYMAGARKDQPNIPNERNPYPPRSRKANEWLRGGTVAMQEVVDGEE